MTHRLIVLALGGIMAASCLLCAAAIGPGHEWGGDYALYISQAQALVTGTTSRLVDAQDVMFRYSTSDPGPSLYPIGFPLMLVPLYVAVGVNLVAFKWLCAATLILSLPLVFAYGTGRLAPTAALAMTAVVGLNVEMTQFADNVRSDLPFLLLTLAALLAVRRWHADAKAPGPHILIGLLLAGSYLTRSIGIALVLGMMAAHAGRDARAVVRDPRGYLRTQVMSLVPYVTFALVVLAARWWYPPATYDNGWSLSITPETIRRNAAYYSMLPAAYFRSTVLWIALLPFMVVGLVRSWRVDATAVAYCAFSMGILLVWRDQEGTRFLIPLFPLLVYFVFCGIASLRAVIPRPGLALVHAGLIAAAAIPSVTAARRDGPRVPDGVESPDATAMFQFVTNNTREDELVVFRWPRIMRLVTGRNSYRVKRVDQLAGTPGTLYIAEEGETLPDPVVFENGRYRIYRLSPGGTAPAR